MSTIQSTPSKINISQKLTGLAPLVSVLVWAGNATVTKAAVDVIAPQSMSFYRWVLALIVLTPITGIGAWKNIRNALPLLPKIVVLSCLGMVVFQSLAYFAAETTSAINIGIIQAITPVLSLFLSIWLASEKLTKYRAFGVILSLSGIIYLTSQGNPVSLLEGGLHTGDGLMLIAVMSSALYGILLKRWSLPLPIWQQLYWQILMASILLIPLWLSSDVSPITLQNIPVILYAGLAASLISPMCWMISIKHYGAARSAQFINLLPVVSVALAALILGEEIHIYHIIGGGMAIFGVIIGSLKNRGQIKT